MFQWGGDNGHGGVQFSLGIGVFPIQFFASFFNTGLGGADRRPEPRKFIVEAINVHQNLQFAVYSIISKYWLLFTFNFQLHKAVASSWRSNSSPTCSCAFLFDYCSSSIDNFCNLYLQVHRNPHPGLALSLLIGTHSKDLNSTPPDNPSSPELSTTRADPPIQSKMKFIVRFKQKQKTFLEFLCHPSSLNTYFSHTL
jgi:hypothetical protein